jgi:hypothetical protein
MENMEEKSVDTEMNWKIWMKDQLNSDKIWKIMEERQVKL